ncbi:MAG: aspartate kinase [Gammaproteobacteria bacterium]|nr:aspartate kinase [Gammaproteobacteria bacterium]
MKILKYGGSSLATDEHIDFVARQIIERKRPGEDVVVVASAMGGTTDKLMSLANGLTDDPPVRELDKLLCTGEYVSTALLAMALQRHGQDAVSLTGSQCGILTSDDHFNAAVEHVDTRRMRKELSEGRIVVAAGFQGRNTDREITTLGLGGSDITAVVLAAALGAGRCEICSDVDGVYSADPRVVSRASRIDEISYAEMLEMARHGASVLNPRAVEHAREHRVEIYSRSTAQPDAGGTLIHDIDAEAPRVVGIASHDELLRLVIEPGQRNADSAADGLLEALDRDDMFVDHIDVESGRRNVLIPAERLPDVDAFRRDLKRRFDERIDARPACSSVSAIGLGVGGADDLRRTSRRYSKQAGVSLQDDFTAEHAITCVVEPDQASRLMNVFHREFDCPAEAA